MNPAQLGVFLRSERSGSDRPPARWPPDGVPETANRNPPRRSPDLVKDGNGIKWEGFACSRCIPNSRHPADWSGTSRPLSPIKNGAEAVSSARGDMPDVKSLPGFPGLPVKYLANICLDGRRIEAPGCRRLNACMANALLYALENRRRRHYPISGRRAKSGVGPEPGAD